MGDIRRGTNLHIASSFGRVLSQFFSANICSRSGRSPNSPGSLRERNGGGRVTKGWGAQAMGMNTDTLGTSRGMRSVLRSVLRSVP